MKIAILNFPGKAVDIVVVEKDYIDEHYFGDVEEFLVNDMHYSLEDIYWMEEANGINIIDSDVCVSK